MLQCYAGVYARVHVVQTAKNIKRHNELLWFHVALMKACMSDCATRAVISLVLYQAAVCHALIKICQQMATLQQKDVKCPAQQRWPLELPRPSQILSSIVIVQVAALRPLSVSSGAPRECTCSFSVRFICHWRA